MNLQSILNIAIPLVAALAVLVPKLARSILFESLIHPLRRTEIQAKGTRMTVGQR